MLVATIKSILAAGLLIGQASIAQSAVVLSEIRFDGELGVPVSELQEYTQFLKGHSLEKRKSSNRVRVRFPKLCGTVDFGRHKLHQVFRQHRVPTPLIKVPSSK